jgi:hypothetical protein
MRERKEIMDELENYLQGDDVNVPRAQQRIQETIIEVLLDIREVLTNKQ